MSLTEALKRKHATAGPEGSANSIPILYRICKTLNDITNLDTNHGSLRVAVVLTVTLLLGGAPGREEAGACGNMIHGVGFMKRKALLDGITCRSAEE
jgi:hypothetical protein